MSKTTVPQIGGGSSFSTSSRSESSDDQLDESSEYSKSTMVASADIYDGEAQIGLQARRNRRGSCRQSTHRGAARRAEGRRGPARVRRGCGGVRRMCGGSEATGSTRRRLAALAAGRRKTGFPAETSARPSSHEVEGSPSTSPPDPHM